MSMKRRAAAALSIAAIVAFSGCGGTPSSGAADRSGEAAGSASGADSSIPVSDGDALVVYFSATGTTERIAGLIADATGADTFRIEPQEPYTVDDLAYNDSDSRVSLERESGDTVPLVSTEVPGWDSYDIVYFGFPIWWGEAAWPINGFVAANDFTGKTVVPFCISGGSSIGNAGEQLAEMAGSGDWLEGARFDSDATADDVASWIAKNGVGSERKGDDSMNARRISVQSGGHTMVYELNDGSAADSLYEMLPLRADVEDYSDNEKIFYPEQTLNTSDSPLARGGTGTLAYYEPWDDVVFFYGDYAGNPGLFELGQVISGGEYIGEMSGTVSIDVIP